MVDISYSFYDHLMLRMVNSCVRDVVYILLLFFDVLFFFFFFQAEDGIRDDLVTGVQTCALPISFRPRVHALPVPPPHVAPSGKNEPPKHRRLQLPPRSTRQSGCETTERGLQFSAAGVPHSAVLPPGQDRKSVV